MFSLLPKQDKDHYSLVLHDTNLTMVCLQHEESGARLKKLEMLPGFSFDQELNTKKVRNFLKQEECSSVVDFGDYKLLSVEAPDVPPNELKAAIRWQIKDLVDFHIDDAVLDVFDMPPSGADNRKHHLYVVVARMSVIKRKVELLQSCRANLNVIDVPELVLRNISSCLPEDRQGVVLVYLAQNHGLITITCESTLYLARGLEFGHTTLHPEPAAESTEAFERVQVNMDRIVLEVQRSLDYYDRYFSRPPVAGLVLCPLPWSDSVLPQYLSSNLGLECRELDLRDIISSDISLEREVQAYATMAIGAALRRDVVAL
ncbi:MAG: hypothetical protein OEZ68_10100 [Gammaproteobacteria bacterium]|nr:hypothetical protein [Gammaproteobacteria bacterium]MDH5801141.1 hypothetical protein [Gammaproteobacteria bacterium]